MGIFGMTTEPAKAQRDHPRLCKNIACPQLAA